jgi:hypothetical protein
MLCYSSLPKFRKKKTQASVATWSQNLSWKAELSCFTARIFWLKTLFDYVKFHKIYSSSILEISHSGDLYCFILP